MSNDVEVFPIRQQIVRCEYCFNRYKCKQAHHAVRWCNGYVGPWNIKSLKKTIKNKGKRNKPLLRKGKEKHNG